MDQNIEALIARTVDRAIERIRREEAGKERLPTKAWLSTAEAAAYLGCDIDWLEKLRRTGGGPRFRKRAARFIKYAVADLDDWMRAAPGGAA